ncbi:HTH_48 domain-containing protein [Trichonephila clavipes]|nr:HTH_48 domain-containing protein [Trichonephila clavipes]
MSDLQFRCCHLSEIQNFNINKHLISLTAYGIKICALPATSAASENDPNILKSIVTGDESWCFQYDPESKRQIVEMKSENSPSVLLSCFKSFDGARIRRIPPEYRTESSWCLFHDNAPNHTSLLVRRFLAKTTVCVSNHPPHSPDLAPCDYSLFPKLKILGYFDDLTNNFDACFAGHSAK